jgi:hypothetical protein
VNEEQTMVFYSSTVAVALALSLGFALSGADAFFMHPVVIVGRGVGVTTNTNTRLRVIDDLGRPPTFLDEQEGGEDGDINVTFLDEEDDDDDTPTTGEGRKRWEALDPKIKERLVEKGQAKAIANRKKREPAADKKRRKFSFTYLSILIPSSPLFLCMDSFMFRSVLTASVSFQNNQYI